MDADIRETFWKALAKSPFVMLHPTEGHPAPMTAMLDKDAHHAVWFFTSRSANAAIPGPASFDFAAKGHDVFAAIEGTLHAENDPARLDKLWSNAVAAWFPGGKGDPDLALMRFEIGQSHVWTADLSVAGMFHLATGTAIQPDQAGQHAVGAV